MSSAYGLVGTKDIVRPSIPLCTAIQGWVISRLGMLIYSFLFSSAKNTLTIMARKEDSSPDAAYENERYFLHGLPVQLVDCAEGD